MLEIQNLSKDYGKKKALRGFNYAFEEGIYGTLGANGAGKSTLMNLITDNLKRTSGNILYNGTEILEMGAKFRALIGYMPQQQGFYENFSARMFLYHMAELKGIRRREAKKQIEHLLQTVNLAGAADLKIGGFSGGMRQRVLLAQALLGDPKILILDEPTAALDPIAESEMYEKYDAMIREKTGIFISHRLSSTRFCDRILFLEEGRIIEEGSHAKLMEQEGAYAKLFDLQARYYQKKREEEEIYGRDPFYA